MKADRQLLEALTATTEGNPFFLDEIVRLMRAESRLASPGPSGTRFNLPDSIRTTVRRRLSPLLDHARRALAIASVIGHEFEFSVLLQVSELTEEQLGEALDQAIASGLVMEAPRAKHYRFTHAIIPEVLRSDLSRKRLPALHWQIASAIERQHRGQLDAHAADIATHYQRALLANASEAGRTPAARSRLKIVNYARRGAKQAV